MSARRFSLLCILTAASAVTGSGLDASPLTRPHTAAFMRGTGTDARRPLPFFYDMYTFRGRNGRTDVVTAFAVEAGNLETEQADGRARYRFSVSLVLADTALRSVSDTHDTVYVDVGDPLDDDHLLYTHVEVLARPSDDIRQRVIMIDATTPGIGQLYSEPFPIPDYSGNELMLSDIALGQPDARSGWNRGNATLALLPTDRFPSSPFEIYYEIYNLPSGHEYVTEIAIHRSGRGAGEAPVGEPVRLRFTGKSAAGRDAMLPELRRVESALPRGSYRLTVTITDLETGAVARRSRAIDVREWKRGATMVAAHPRDYVSGAGSHIRR